MSIIYQTKRYQKDDGDRNVIPQSIGLIAGRTAQEYNNRKNRKGAFWEDRYHSTAIETGEHLLRCLAYVELNMVRAGVVKHPSEWQHFGYHEIQAPRRKNVIIAYDRLCRLTGFKDYEAFRLAYEKWVKTSIEEKQNRYDDRWSKSIAVGSGLFEIGVRSTFDH